MKFSIAESNESPVPKISIVPSRTSGENVGRIPAHASKSVDVAALASVTLG
ncbi:unannotated protein [freshwater metagenome]|uniref:Unannotated protein n=1 Tax=freshwater metagenome TaxID=449393 RepID=A0A6J6M822_9ZZZZ